MAKEDFKKIKLISNKEINNYYEYLLNAFKKELLGVSRRQLIEEISNKVLFSKEDESFLRNIINNAFENKDPYKKKEFFHHKFEHPIELLNFIVQEGYTPSSPFVIWAHKRFNIKWNAMHWLLFLYRDLAPIDLIKIKNELRHLNKNELPQTLEFYYRLGTGLERIYVRPEIGIKMVLKKEFEGIENYKGFDPIDYLDYYYGGLDKEDMTIAKTFYDYLIINRSKFNKDSCALIIGNGPNPDEAQTLAMIPEIKKIIPADIDERNIKIMQSHTGNRNPLATQKARPGEEHADFIYYLFEKTTKARYGFFCVREITAVKTKDPAYIDVSKENPLNMPKNSEDIKNLKPDLIVVPFCPESITNSLEKYREYLRNISNLSKKKSFLCMLALKKADFYLSGVKKLEAVPINEKIVYDELVKNNYININITTIETGLSEKQRGFSDSMIIWAEKS